MIASVLLGQPATPTRFTSPAFNKSRRRLSSTPRRSRLPRQTDDAVRRRSLRVRTTPIAASVVTTRTYTPQTGLISGVRAGVTNAVASFDYQFDLIGNLTQRTDNDLARTDTFAYDPLNRLSTYTLAGGGLQTMGYDALGSITSKPGVGTYAYPAAGQPRPHAVSSITGTVRGVVNPSFAYDADGNTLSGAGVTATYTAFDMPATVSSGLAPAVWGSSTWGSPTAWGGPVSLAYDSEHQRVSMTGPTSTTYYWNDPVSGAGSEFVSPPAGAAQWRDFLMADGRMVAERTAVTGGATSFQYFVQDHLGSIAVATDGTGAVIERMLYDPWGQQLDKNGAPICGSGAPTTRGYTGEEQFPVGCLVNLNARLYDPILGRFMVGDPVVASVYDQQALNRYSYVRDNPLSLTDTNGECPVCLIAVVDAAFVFFAAEAWKPLLEEHPILGDLFVIADAVVCGPCGAEAAGIIAGVESGSVGKGVKAFVIALAEQEAFKDVGAGLNAVKGGLTAAEYTAASFVAHGLVGGTFSVIQGGSFGSGFLSAGVSDLAEPYVNHGNRAVGTIEEAVIGGTISVIGGGKFGNGAITSAFAYIAKSLAQGRPSETIDPDLSGKHVDLTVPGGAAGAAAGAKVTAAIQDIDLATGLTAEQIAILHDINSIIVSDSIARSYVDEPTGTFYLQLNEVMHGSIPFIASTFFHDAFHIFEYATGGFSYSRSLTGEIDAFTFQVGVGPLLGLSQYELNYLRGFLENPSSYLPRMNQKPN